MPSNYKIRFAGVVLLLVMCLDACKKKEESTSPCAGYSRPKAIFQTGIVDGVSLSDKFIPYDSFLCPGGASVTLKSLTPNAEEWYWQIGDDPRIRTGKIIDVSFADNYGKVKVTHWVKYKPNTICDPLDDGADTATGSILLLDSSYNPWHGHFEGYDTASPNHTFKIWIDTKTGPYRVYNFPEGCQKDTMPFTSYYKYKWMSILNFEGKFVFNNDIGGCYMEDGAASLTGKSRDTLIVTYKNKVIIDKKEVLQKRKFIGWHIK